MNINDLAVAISRREAGKKQVNIAQIKEILKVINWLSSGEFYKWVRGL